MWEYLERNLKADVNILQQQQQQLYWPLHLTEIKLTWNKKSKLKGCWLPKITKKLTKLGSQITYNKLQY